MLTTIEQKLEQGGWDQAYDPAAGVWGIGVFQRNGRTVCLPERKVLETADIFERLRDLVEGSHPRISDIVFVGGGTLEIPDWFREFCKANGVHIHVLADGGDLPADFG
jgi:hypothetical protein